MSLLSLVRLKMSLLHVNVFFTFLYLTFFAFLDEATSANFLNKFLVKAPNGSPTLLGGSAISMWMQRKGIARRVCQRVESTELYDSGISPRTALLNIGRCQIQLVKSTAGRPLSAHQKACPDIQACIPSMAEVIETRTPSGIDEVTSTVSCACVSRVSGCQRRQSLRVFYKGTKFERIVDVGECAGNCENKRCQPLVMKTMAIKSPNGRRTVNIVKECGCRSSCYRISYKKAYQVLIRNATATKVIDVGRCSSSSACSGHVQGKCLYWAKPVVSSQQMPAYASQPEKICLLRSKSRPLRCYAKTSRLVTLNTPGNPNKEIVVINNCACS